MIYREMYLSEIRGFYHTSAVEHIRLIDFLQNESGI